LENPIDCVSIGFFILPLASVVDGRCTAGGASTVRTTVIAEDARAVWSHAAQRSGIAPY
jgi:hypothetical protein